MRYKEDNELHLDFHGTANTTFDYIAEHFGVEALKSILRKTGHDVYKSIREKLAKGDASELVEHIMDMAPDSKIVLMSIWPVDDNGRYKGYNGNICRSTTNINYHATFWFIYIYISTKSCCKWLFYNNNPSSTSGICSILYCLFLHLGYPAGNTDADPGFLEGPASDRFLDKMLQHLFRLFHLYHLLL